MTTAQRGVWFAQRFDPAATTFNSGHYLDIHGPVDANHLREAIRRAEEECGSYGVRLIDGPQGPRQRLTAAGTPPLQSVDLTAAADPHAAALAWMDRDHRTPLDLLRDDLSRDALLKVGAERYLWYRRCHHILTDAFGGVALTRRVAELYAAAVRGEPAAGVPLGHLSALLADETAYLESEQYTRDRAYWTGRFADRPEPVSLSETPVDTPPAGPVSRTVTLTEADMAALRTAGRAARTPWTVPVIAAVAAYLHGMTGVRDLTLGVPVTARRGPGTQNVPGMVANQLPLKLTVDPARTWGHLLTQVARELGELLVHQSLPYEELRRELDLVRDDGQLFGIVVNVLPLRGDLRFGGHPTHPRPLPGGTVLDLNISVRRGPGGEILLVDFEANPGRYTQQQLDAHQRRFVTYLRALAAADADQPLGRVALTSDDERARLLRTDGGTGPQPRTGTLSALFEEQVRTAPAAPAVHRAGEPTASGAASGTTLTYAELNARANRLARVLVAHGAGPDRFVAVAMPRCVDAVVAFVAVLKSGAAYLPVDITYPADRIAHVLRDARPTVVLTVTGTVLPDGAGVQPLAVDTPGLLDGADDGDLTDAERVRPSRPEDAAYVIYTSGSTGVPKGVVVPHLGVPNLLAAQSEPLGLRKPERVLLFASPGFDASVWELCSALLTGSCAVVADRTRLLPGPALADLVAETGVSLLLLAPSALAVMPEGGLPPGVTLVVGAEACAPGLVERWSAGRRMVNAYGPTEATVIATMSRPLTGRTVPPMGRPVLGSRILLLDDALRPVPEGVPGELYIAGQSLARGYVNRPDLTAERFVANPFGPPGTRMYRSGDVARWSAEGELEYLGRSDHQVKLRGFRIELGEVEAALADQPSVAQATVLVREDHPGVRRLVGYAVAAPGHGLDPAGLRRALAEVLPEYMVPAAVVELAELPRTPSGKLDRAALPAPVVTGGSGGRAPATERETLLCALVAEVLGATEVGPDDNFFDLGGDSITAIRLAARAAEAGLVLTPQQIFSGRTAQALAEAAREPAPAAPAPVTAALELGPDERAHLETRWPASDVEAVLPLTPLQEGMLFHALFDRDGADAYTVQKTFGIAGELDPARLRTACEALLRRHGALRAGFDQTMSGRPVQLVLADVEVPFTETDLSGYDGKERRARTARLLAEDKRRRFDMARPPLLRFTLIRTAPEQHVMVLTSHHILFDGWSLPLVLRDLFALYRSAGDDLALPEAVPFGTYLDWLAGQDRAAAEDAWREALADLEQPTLVAPDAPPQTGTTLPGLAVAELSAELTGKLTEGARTHGLTLNTVVQGAWAMVLGGLTGRRDVLFGATVSGRPAHLPGVSDIVGLLMNTVPVRVRTRPGEPLAALLARLQAQQAELGPHQYLGLADVRRIAGHGELFDTTTVFENAPIDRAGIRDAAGGLRITQTEADQTGATHYPLSLIVVPGSRLRLELTYRTDVFASADIRSIVDRVKRVFETFVTAPQTAVGRIELLTPAEHHAAVERPNATARPYPATTLPRLFAEQVRRTPGAPAVVHGERTLSYAELDRAAGTLAAVLATRGAGPGQVVAVRLPRSAELLITLHAVLRAGAAYLPVDPGYPDERVRNILEDADPVLLIDEDAYRTLTDTAADTEPLAPVDGLHPLHPAYVIHTSGSTGRPKGIVVAHEGIANYLRWKQDAFPLGPGDRVLQRTSMSFDPSVWEIFWPLAVGATVVIAEPETQHGPGYLASVIRREQVTVAQFVPSTLELFLQEPGARDCRSLRRVFCGGEALTAGLADRFHAALDAELHNLYGPTEVSVYTTSRRARPGGTGSVPVGLPGANLRAYVLDDGLLPAAAGVEGELYIAGTGVTRGYVNRPALTAERFVPDPFGPPGTRMYRTGDLAVRRPDGELEYRGRVDHQVKVAGHRIEPGEIETVLGKDPAVLRAAVVVREDRPGTPTLVGYVVTAPGAVFDPDALRGRLAGALPDYMVPAALVELERIPLSPNGKLDRKALPEPEFTGAADSREPRDAREELLCALFAELLGLDRVGIDDSFFDLGGDSIASTRLAGRARTAGLALTPRDVFTHRTVAALVDVARDIAPGPSRPVAPRGPLVLLEQDELDELEAQLGDVK
ncbi:amino acid adenylation domain-containing protein [Streptomyces sp. NPDC090083]|uniref:amino acid adenylation domain-containing protein n=1 Tax=Streptomyces sp. NPDC090083 TaxID=3365941 RepID=UPI00382E661B